MVITVLVVRLIIIGVTRFEPVGPWLRLFAGGGVSSVAGGGERLDPETSEAFEDAGDTVLRGEIET